MFKTIFQNLKKIHRTNFTESRFPDFKVVDKNCCYVTIVTFHNSKVSKIK